MRTLVIHHRDESAVPFLRGILTRSLLDAGLEFEDAFRLASEVRDELYDTPEVASEALHERVMQLLKREGFREESILYDSALVVPDKIEVTARNHDTTPFSRGRHARYLQSCGMKPDKAEVTTNLIYENLLMSGVTSISTCELGYLTWLCLCQEVSRKAARRYLAWSAFQRSDRPLFLLICGTVGSGKSTVASEIAHLLEVVRTQSTDMLREVMRMMIPVRLLPVLHESSFNAWMALPITEGQNRDRDDMVADGYRSQSELLAVACEAVMQRSAEERESLIIEGVHAHPALVEHIPEQSDAVVVHVTLAVLKKKELKSRLRGRGIEVPARRAERYLDGLASIWSLQSHLLSEADSHDTPIINNKDREKCILQVVRQVNYELGQCFPEEPQEVFGDVVPAWIEAAGSNKPWHEYLALVAAD